MELLYCSRISVKISWINGCEPSTFVQTINLEFWRSWEAKKYQGMSRSFLAVSTQVSMASDQLVFLAAATLEYPQGSTILGNPGSTLIMAPISYCPKKCVSSFTSTGLEFLPTGNPQRLQRLSPFFSRFWPFLLHGLVVRFIKKTKSIGKKIDKIQPFTSQNDLMAIRYRYGKSSYFNHESKINEINESYILQQCLPEATPWGCGRYWFCIHTSMSCCMSLYDQECL